jgi:hypothetical protein
LRHLAARAPGVGLSADQAARAARGGAGSVAYGPAAWAVEGDFGAKRRSEPADALAAASRRQDEQLESSADVIGLAVGEHQRDAAGGFDGSVGFDPGEKQALGPSPLGRGPAGHQE